MSVIPFRRNRTGLPGVNPRMRSGWIALLGAVTALPLTGAAEPASLPLEAYLDQVRAGHAGLRAAEETARSIPLMAQEAELIYSPLFRATGGRVDNRAEGSSPLQPERTIAGAWDLALSKKFSTGTTLSADYGLNYTHILYAPIPGFPAALFPSAPFYDARPSLTVSQSLLRDFLGGMTDAGLRRTRALAAAGAAASRYRARAILLQAEMAYWTASLARDTVEFSRSSADRTNRLIQWTEKKVGLNLAEDSDLLQVRAAGKLRELNLRMAEQDLAAAERALNALRGRTDRAVPDALERINERLNATIAPAPVATATRLDVEAAELAVAAAEQGDRETRYRSLPEINAFGTVALNGHDPAAGGASGEAFEGDHPTYTVGVAFVAPLDVSTLRRARAGYAAQSAAARRDAEQARLNASQDWSRLAERWEDVTSRLALAREIEALQQQKLAAETQRFSEGRTTTFQLLQFEEEFSQAQLTRLRLGLERLLLEAQARFYNAR